MFDACSELIARISESDEEEEKMKINFRHNLYVNESLASTEEAPGLSADRKASIDRRTLQTGRKLRAMGAMAAHSRYNQQKVGRRAAVKAKSKKLTKPIA